MNNNPRQIVLGIILVVSFIAFIFLIYKNPIPGVIALVCLFLIKNKMAYRIIAVIGFLLFVGAVAGFGKEATAEAEKFYNHFFSTSAIFLKKGGIANFFSFFSKATFSQIFYYFIVQSAAIFTVAFFFGRLMIFGITFSGASRQHKKVKPDATANFSKLEKIYWDKNYPCVPLGVQIDSGNGKNPIAIQHNVLNKHLMLVGTTGSGKTVTLYNFIANALLHDKPVIFIDGKGDLSNIKKFENLCKNEHFVNKRPYVVTIDGETGYNPFSVGTPTELTDKIISMFDWSEEHYKLSSSRFILNLIRYMMLENIDINLASILKYSNLDTLTNYHATRQRQVLTNNTDQSPRQPTSMLGSIPTSPAMPSVKERTEKGPLHDEAGEILQTIKTIDSKAIQGIQSRLAPLAEGDSRRLFTNKNTINLDDIIARGDRILFSLDSLRYPEQARGLGRLIINDLKACVSAHQRRGGGRVALFFDEFNVFASHEVVDVINKSRSAGFEALLAFQSLADIDKLDKGKELRSQIIQNCNTLIVQLQNDSDDAQNLANSFGTRKTIERTLQTQDGMASGMGSEKVVDEYNVNPNDIKFMKVGQAWIKSDGGICKIQVANFI